MRNSTANPSFIESVIHANIAQKQAELVEANERARIELIGSTEPPL